MEGQEIEVKYYVLGLQNIEQRAKSLGARLVQPRTHEINLRFDTPANDLKRSFCVLRLRRDTENRLTYKGPSEDQDGVRVRQEIEFTVGDFETARAFLEALGYQVEMIYEKYRTVYDLDQVHITLDEMPYGDFVELEGPNTQAIKDVNQQLNLDWSARAPDSYTVIFDRLRADLNLPFHDLIFENFLDLEISSSELGIEPADQDMQ